MADILPKPDDSVPVQSPVKSSRRVPETKRTLAVLTTIIIIAILCLMAGYVYDVVSNHNRDNTRKSDISYISNALEQYYGLYHYYPSLSQINSSTFGALAPNLDRSKFKDPSSTSSSLSAQPSSSSYAYEVMPSGCNNVSVYCTSYKLVATLSDGSLYTVSSPAPKS